MTPRILIPLPTSFDLEYNRLNFSAYTDAIRTCGGEPVEVALDLAGHDLAQLAAVSDGILLPGSPADVDPERYGQMPEGATAFPDPLREAVDRFLLEDALHARKPIFGICFGMQFLNVFLGGTLVQDVSILPVNHAAGRGVAVAHSVSVVPGSLLAKLVAGDEISEVDGRRRLPVNSSHHQAVGIAGSGLTVVARCPQDGVVEAVEGADHEAGFVLGVQWHPERTLDSNSSSRILFSGFVDYCLLPRPVAARRG